MSSIEVLSTAAHPASKKVDYWNEITCDALTGLVIDPLDPTGFEGCLTRMQVGELRIAEASAGGSKVRHLRRHVAGLREPLCMLHCQLSGQSVTRQDGREALLEPGDITLCDNTRPYDVYFDHTVSMLVLRVPRSVLERHIAQPEAVAAISLDGSSGAAGLASRFIRDLWQHSPGLNATRGSQLARIVLDLIANAYLDLPQAVAAGSSVATARRVQIIQHIEAHLREPALTPASVAQALRMTPRYLHQVFQREQESVGRYILRRRLESCALVLADPLQTTRSITAIALDHGFCSSAHFSSAFRERYGLTPREYRHQGLLQG